MGDFGICVLAQSSGKESLLSVYTEMFVFFFLLLPIRKIQVFHNEIRDYFFSFYRKRNIRNRKPKENTRIKNQNKTAAQTLQIAVTALVM